MKVNLISSFSAGLLLATGICTIAYFSSDSHVSKAAGQPASNQASVSKDAMKKQLTDAGYIVQTKDEYNKNLDAAKNGTAQQEAAAPADAQQQNVSQAVINVADGMTSIDVGRMLVSANLVPDAFQFSKDIEARGLQNKLRPGTYTVDSGMSYDQIIAAIFH